MTSKKIFILIAIYLLFLTSFAVAQTTTTSVTSSSSSGNVIGEIEKQVRTLGCQVYTILFYLATAIAALFILFSGIKYMSSESPDDRYEARDRIVYAIIGLVIVLVSCPMVDYFIKGTKMEWKQMPACCPVFSSGGSGGQPPGQMTTTTVTAATTTTLTGNCQKDYKNCQDCLTGGCTWCESLDSSKSRCEKDCNNLLSGCKSGIILGTCYTSSCPVVGSTTTTTTPTSTTTTTGSTTTTMMVDNCKASYTTCQSCITGGCTWCDRSSISGTSYCEKNCKSGWSTCGVKCDTQIAECSGGANPSSTDCDDLGGICSTQDECTQAGATSGLDVECKTSTQCSPNCCCAEKNSGGITITNFNQNDVTS